MWSVVIYVADPHHCWPHVPHLRDNRLLKASRIYSYPWEGFSPHHTATKSIIYTNYKLKLHTQWQQDLEVTNSPLHKEPIYVTFYAHRITDFDVWWESDWFWLVLVTFGVFGILGSLGFCIFCVFCVLYVSRFELLCFIFLGRLKTCYEWSDWIYYAIPALYRL